MVTKTLPNLDVGEISDTRYGLHAYSGIVGGWMSRCRSRRKHWWHASMRPALTGTTSGVIDVDDVRFQLDLDFKHSKLTVHTGKGDALQLGLHGQPAEEPARRVWNFLVAAGVPEDLATTAFEANSQDRETTFSSYSAAQAEKLGEVLVGVSGLLASFRAGVREETSPIGIWPHHFDLAMLWLPGSKIAGQDPANEEYADKQMNFGFTFGDAVIAEPYFYITAYPFPEALTSVALPSGAEWRTEGFSGAVLTYQRLLEEADPSHSLIQLWEGLLTHGRTHLG